MKNSVIWFLALLILACSFDNKTQTKPSKDVLPKEMKSVSVTLQIFSGRVNPSWKLSEPQTVELFLLLRALPKSDPLDFHGGLGYSGFRIAFAAEKKAVNSEILSYRGQIFYQHGDTKEYFTDAERKLEMFLLKSGNAEIGAEHIKRIKTEIAQPPVKYTVDIPRSKYE